MRPSVTSVKINRYEDALVQEGSDLLCVEEPMEIRLLFGPEKERKEQSISVTMRTPGHDFELAIGFLFTEGIIRGMQEVLSIRYCISKKEEEQENIVRVELSPAVEPDLDKLKRHFYTSSSCGVCGKTSLEAVRTLAGSVLPSPADAIKVSSAVLRSLRNKLQEEQLVFNRTGGLHAAALFDEEGNLLLVREDVGRHNALDKMIGAVLAKPGIELGKHFVLLSGRAGFELVQKAALAGLPLLAAIGAPSGLSVQLAREFNMTLIGFLREDRFNIYCGKERVKN